MTTFNIGTVRIGLCCGKKKKPRLRWTIGPVSEQRLTPGPWTIPMLQLTDSQQCDLSIAPIDKKGFPAPVEPGSVSWTSSDAAVADVVQDPADQLKATVVAGQPGTAQINVSADADLGAGVATISGALDVTVVGGLAVSLSVSTGTPVDQAGGGPPAPPVI